MRLGDSLAKMLGWSEPGVMAMVGGCQIRLSVKSDRDKKMGSYINSHLAAFLTAPLHEDTLKGRYIEGTHTTMD